LAAVIRDRTPAYLAKVFPKSGNSVIGRGNLKSLAVLSQSTSKCGIVYRVFGEIPQTKRTRSHNRRFPPYSIAGVFLALVNGVAVNVVSERVHGEICCDDEAMVGSSAGFYSSSIPYKL